MMLALRRLDATITSIPGGVACVLWLCTLLRCQAMQSTVCMHAINASWRQGDVAVGEAVSHGDAGPSIRLPASVCMCFTCGTAPLPGDTGIIRECEVTLPLRGSGRGEAAGMHA